MSQLHEVLAVDKPLEEDMARTVAETINTFTKKVEHFNGHLKTLAFYDESRAGEAAGFGEVVQLTDTVPSKLKYTSLSIVKHLDSMAQKEFTNVQTKADVILKDGSTLINDAPAPFLLSLENKLAKLIHLYNAIPTRRPGVEWLKDEEQGEDIWRAKEELVRHKTEKVYQSRIAVEATEHHPAQIQSWTEDKAIGDFTTVQYTGMLSPGQKSALLGRLTSLIHAVKKARQRANREKVVQIEIGETIMNYING